MKMDMEINARCNAQADAEITSLVEAYNNGQLSDYLDEMLDSVEIKCGIVGDMQNFEYTLCAGGPTGILTYEGIEISWGSEVARRHVDKEIANAIWDYTEERFKDCLSAKFNRGCY